MSIGTNGRVAATIYAPNANFISGDDRPLRIRVGQDHHDGGNASIHSNDRRLMPRFYVAATDGERLQRQRK